MSRAAEKKIANYPTLSTKTHRLYAATVRSSLFFPLCVCPVSRSLILLLRAVWDYEFMRARASRVFLKNRALAWRPNECRSMKLKRYYSWCRPLCARVSKNWKFAIWWFRRGKSDEYRCLRVSKKAIHISHVLVNFTCSVSRTKGYILKNGFPGNSR